MVACTCNTNTWEVKKTRSSRLFLATWRHQDQPELNENLPYKMCVCGGGRLDLSIIRSDISVYVPKRFEHRILRRDLHIQVDRSIIQSCQEVEYRSNDEEISKNAVYSYSEI